MRMNQALSVLGALLMLTVVGCATTPVCQIYFVPIGTFPDTMTQDLIRHYDQTLNLRIQPLQALPVTDDMVDPTRKQLIGEEVIRKMKEQWPDLATDPNVRLLGMTGDDMFIRSKQWHFAFALRKEGRFALVSKYRMDPTFFKLPPNDDVMVTRLRKMLTKQIGLQYYGLPDRQEKTSVLFSPIMGLDDLDAIAPEFDSVDRERIAQLPRPCPMPPQPTKPAT
jgi:predicted Zn-dependent protease